ncbi:MAG TPA: hypothetical protein VK832_17800, partial [Burkholderiaceae bacterium]|nr:hypothetical protein [Burkholderiaceae bacterium]
CPSRSCSRDPRSPKRTMDAAYAAHPERFVHGKPKVRSIPTASYINRPQESNVGESGTAIMMAITNHGVSA